MRATLGLTALDVRSKAGKLALQSAAPPISVGDDRLRVPAADLRFHRGRTAFAGDRGRRRAQEAEQQPRGEPVRPKSRRWTSRRSLSVLPRVERASGTLEASLNVTGKVAAPVYSGEAHLKKAEFSMRGLAMPLSDVNVDLAIGGGEVRVTRGTGNVGGGAFTLAGHAPIHGFNMGDVSGVITAKGVSLPVVDGISMTCDADLRAEWSEHGGEEDEPSLPKVSGDVVLTSFSYTRPIGIGRRHRIARAARASQDVRVVRSGRRLRHLRRQLQARAIRSACATTSSKRSSWSTPMRSSFRGPTSASGCAGGCASCPAGASSARQRVRGAPRVRALRRSDPHRAERRRHRGHRVPPLFGRSSAHRAPPARTARPAAAAAPAASGASPFTPTATPTTCAST